MHNTQLSKQQEVHPEIALVFPPLVETNFGSYYPSTAVLAGYLSAAGIGSVQADFNEDFAVHLLNPENLERMGKGDFGEGISLPPESMPAVSARMLARYNHLLFDDQGRHRFREDSSEAAYLLNILVKPYRLDMALGDMTQTGLSQTPGARIFREFYKQIKFIHALPASVHTVGIVVPVGPQLGPALILGSYLKEIIPQLAVILGGPTMSLMAPGGIERIISSNPAIDAIVSSDGEYPLKSLVEQKRAGIWEPEKVPGVSCRAGATVVHQPPTSGPDLDSLPFAKYDSSLLARLSKPEIGIVQARGCYWGKCAYCDYIEIYRGNPAFRTRKPDNFIDEMEYQLNKHSVNRFSVITEAIPPAFAEKISRIILQRKLGVIWQSFAVADKHFTSETLNLVAKAGCEFLAVGLETMTSRVLSLMHKAATGEENINFLRAAKKAGLKIKINLIPDLPTTTYREAMDSLAIVRELHDCFSYISYFPFEVTLSSLVGRQPEFFGLQRVRSSTETGQAQFRINHLEVIDPAMTGDEKGKVLAAYKDFAACFNNTAVEKEPENTTNSNISLESALFVLADENLDLIETEKGIQCYNWTTRTRFQIPAEWLPVIEKMRACQPFRWEDFSRWFSSTASAEFYFDKLLEKGILTIYEPLKKS
ncbi:MAG: radical SAM protein [Dehalococcoidia bacterium]|nr:MAG: radical SAM protein [Dehalococcoidia bacterium]